MIGYSPTDKKLGDTILFVFFASFGVVVLLFSRAFSLIVIIISACGYEELIITEQTKLKKSILPAILPLLFRIDVEPPMIDLLTKVLDSLQI